MASKLPSSPLYIIFLFFHLLLPTNSSVSVSLSTVSISKASNNNTIICALLIHHSFLNQPFLNCTTFPTNTHFLIPYPNISISAVTGGNGFQCLLTTPTPTSTSVTSLSCLRFSPGNLKPTYKRIYIGPVLEELQAGDSHICGRVYGTNLLRCWQWREFDNNRVQILRGIAVGGEFVCGLSEFGAIECFGNDTAMVINAPKGNFSCLGAGLRHACGISLDGRISCWGDAVGNVPVGEFTSLALGDHGSCGIRTNSTVACWGRLQLPKSLVDVKFFSIQSKGGIVCGIVKSNFSLFCFDGETFNTSLLVFNGVKPGPCQMSCPCGDLPGSAVFCTGGAICETCQIPKPTPHASPPALRPSQTPSNGRISPTALAPSPSPTPSKGPRIVYLVVGSVGAFAFAIVLCFFLYRYCKQGRCRVHDSGRSGEVSPYLQNEARRQQNTPPQCLEKKVSHLFSQGNGGQLQEFSLQELLLVTKNFSQDHKIGYGSFGTVYRATLVDGRDVAIKRAELTCLRYGVGIKRQDDKECAFLSELSHLSRVNHKNLVKLYGFCEEINELVLVYEFLSNGTLSDHLHKLDDSPLQSWTARLTVALDAARGIEYLHKDVVPSIIHRDIKSSNILLDSTWTAKVADFGLSLMGPEDEQTHLSLRPAGTVGYMDPEYYRWQQLTTKSDVYSFGVVLLELLSGYKAIHPHENGAPRNVVDFIVPYIEEDQLHNVLDPRVPPPMPHEIESVIYIGYLAADCVSLEGRDRPPMTEIVSILEGCLGACGMQPDACGMQLSLSRSATRSENETRIRQDTT